MGAILAIVLALVQQTQVGVYQLQGTPYLESLDGRSTSGYAPVVDWTQFTSIAQDQIVRLCLSRQLDAFQVEVWDDYPDSFIVYGYALPDEQRFGCTVVSHDTNGGLRFAP